MNTSATNGARTQQEQTTATTAAALEPLLRQFAQLVAETLAPALAAALAAHGAPAAAAPPRRLLSLDELVALLPPAKTPTTWKRWLYERTRKNQIPGCHRIGGRLFFDAEHTIAALTGQPLDLPGQQSFHHTTLNTSQHQNRAE